MTAAFAHLGSRKEKRIAFVTGSPDALPGFLVHEVMTTSHLVGSPEDIDLGRIKVIVGDDRGILLVGLDNGSPLQTARDELLFGTLWRVSSAAGAPSVLAVGTFLFPGEVRIALVAVSSYAHTNWLVHPQDSIIL